MKQWNLKAPSSEAIQILSQELKLSKLLVRLLINRGMTTLEEASSFLNDSLKNLPSPFLLKNMDKAVDRILRAMEAREKIVIYGDYDVDGTCATSLLVLFFREIGFPISTYIPHRLREGYSLNNDALKKLKEEGAHVVMTVDNGIASFEGALTAKSLGLDLIVTDHHEILEKIPEAYAVINPLQSDCPYPAKNICGTGVAFNLLMALRQKLREHGYFLAREEPNLKRYLDLVALATVADVVSLTGVNRIFVKEGLPEITASLRPGLRALKEVAGITGEVSASHLGFRLGPRLNACGRLYDAAAGVRLLTTTDPTEAATLARELNEANQERQKIEETILLEAVAQLEKDPGTKDRLSHVVYHPDWHPGVVGIVASRLVSLYHRPVIVLGGDKKEEGVPRLKGSGRSFAGLDLVETIRECSEVLTQCGGHKAAAGLSLPMANVEELSKRFEEGVRRRISAKDCLPELHLDAELHPDEVNAQLVTEIESLAPYGQGNPEPLFCAHAILPKNGRVVGEKHYKFQIISPKQVLSAMAFGWGKKSSIFAEKIDLAFSCEFNTYQGIKSVMLNVKDVKIENSLSNLAR